MPDKRKPNYNDPDFQKFLEQIKVIGTSESGNDYTVENGKSSATGKYQYLQAHLKHIIPLSREMGMPISTMEEFKANPGLQEAYFTRDQYKAFEWAKSKIANNNPFDYNLAELAALRHFQGEAGANEILTTGRHKKGDTINPSTKSYIEGTFRKNLMSSGLYTQSGEEKNRIKADKTEANKKAKIQSQYFKELENIKNQKFDSSTENAMINTLNQKYFDEGNLEMVNRKIDYKNNENLKKINKLTLEPKEKIKSERNNAAIDKTYVAVDKKNADLKKPQSPFKYQRIELSQYEKPALIAAMDDTEEVAAVDQSTAMANPTAAPAIIPSQVGAPKTTFDNSEVLDMFNPPEMFTDQQFQYSPGGMEIPLEAAGYLIAGLQGVKAGNTQAPMRDEEVSPLLRNYAAKVKQISEMGLDPATEGDLKNKLASFYQTGLENITRASNGNRNLVLGNQGQLDQARVQGLTNIAALDIDRRDKALADYGEVVKYMDSFYANRDIANNERQYREVEKTQQAGAQLAARGFSALIDSIKYAKENGPGSANDMMEQYLMYQVSGVNPGLEDDGTGLTPGTKSYIDAQRVVQTGRKTEREKMKTFYSSQSKEDREKFNKFMYENDHLNPASNRDVTFDTIKSEFEKSTGVDQAQQQVDNKAGIISLTDQQLNNPAAAEVSPTFGPTQTKDYFDFGASSRVQTPLLPGTPAIIQQANAAAQPQDTTALIQRLSLANAEAENYLATGNKKTNALLDDMLQGTEKQTADMKTQIKTTY